MNAPVLDIAAIRSSVPMSAVVGASVKLKRTGSEYVGCCPFHSERTPSFTVNDDKGFFHCFGCGAHGDVLDFVMQAEGVGLRDAADRIGSGHVPVLPERQRPPEPERDTVAEALTIWRSASSARGTAAEAYLRGRGIHIPIPETIRFARLPYGRRGDPIPCLVAVVGSTEGKVIGIQRTYLKPDGSGKADVPAPKLSLGRIRGGAIRLAPAAGELVVTEGMEDALTLQQELGRSVWAAAGASMLPSMVFPSGVRSIVIGADNDASGEREARKAGEAFSDCGLEVRMMRPDAGFKDFNDQLRGMRI